jgi:AcrR family transcriptional regulator
MGRKPDPGRREKLLEAAVDHVYEHGLGDLSLRPLARSLGTSPRMLIYHFGSKERLLSQLLAAARDRQRQMIADWLARGGDADPAELMRRFWTWSVAPRNLPFLRLFFEVYGRALQDPGSYPGFLERAIDDALPLLTSVLREAGIPDEEAESIATQGLALHRGLLLDLLATGDRRRVLAAHEDLMSNLEDRLARELEEATA